MLQVKDGTGTLEHPVTVLNISASENEFNFIAVQLNTLDLGSTGGVKNFLWTDLGNRMYVKQRCQPWKHPNREYTPTHYSNYDPMVFKKFLAMYLYNYLK